MKQLLVLGAVAIFMIGCPHHGHLRAHKHKPKIKIKPMAQDDHITPQDPVCGRTVDLAVARRAVRGGDEYAFCSPACLDRFVADPLRYETPDR